MANQTYRRLDSEILTVITLTVYDFDVVRQYKEEMNRFTESNGNLDAKSFYLDNIDWNEVEIFDDESFSRGLFTWFKPARLGR